MSTLYIILAAPIILFILLNLERRFFGVPYIASTDARARVILKLLGPVEGAKVADLGSGDGKLLAYLAEAGAECEGFEINPILVWRSEQKLKKRGLAERARVYRKDFWREDLSSFDAVTIYGIGDIMGKLERKLQSELRPGARVVSNTYQFPTWEPVSQEDNVFLYVK